MSKKTTICIIFSIFICISLLRANEIDDVVPFKFINSVKIDNYTTRIPFKLIDRLLIIEGSLDSKKGNFIIDTGSESLILNKVHFKNANFYNDSRHTAGVLGKIEQTLEKKVKRIRFDNLNFKNANAHVINLSHIEKSKNIKLLGIIGYTILEDYEIFIDLYLNQITLTKTDHKGNVLGKKPYLEKIVDTIEFSRSKHSIVLNAFIENKKVRFALDTGAEFNQLNASINKKVLKNFYPKSTVVLNGASGKKIEVVYGNLHRVKLNDDNYFGPMKTIVTNLSNMSDAFGTHLDGVLGYDFFAQKRVIINYKKETLYFINYPILRH